jgi:hypothetical protein
VNGDEFIAFYPKLNAIGCYLNEIAHFVLNTALSADRVKTDADFARMVMSEEPFTYWRDEWWKHFGSKLQESLNDAQIQEIEPEWLAIVQELLETTSSLSESSMSDSGTMWDLNVFVDEVLDAFHPWVDALMEQCLGPWGAHFFIPFVAYVAGHFQRPKQFDPLYDLHVAGRTNKSSRGAKYHPPVHLRPKRDEVTIDTERFLVRMGDLQPCVLRNTKQFWLLSVLYESLNRFVPFEEIAERMGGDSHDVDALSALKHRLVSRLKQAGYDRLANCIESIDGHYGLMLADQ